MLITSFFADSVIQMMERDQMHLTIGYKSLGYEVLEEKLAVGFVDVVGMSCH